MKDSLELCVWKATLLLNERGEGTTFDVADIERNPVANVCYTFCDGYGNLPCNLKCLGYISSGLEGGKK